MSSIYALLVGINRYHPDTNINPLSGCENDVKRFEEYLGQSFPEEKRTIKTLSGPQATRDEVIRQFKAVLINANIQPGDIALFYFSGHGSYARSNPAFKDYDTLERDETLVLYDSRCDGKYDLADKELALLLNKIPAGADIVCIIDSCHSGSITRSIDLVDAITLGKARHTPARDTGEFRELSAYLSLDDDLNYERMAAAGRLVIPSTRHIVLSACDRGEVAYESSALGTGVFSNALLAALEEGGLSYAMLFEYVYALLQRQSKQQTPQLRVYEGYNPEKVFLGDGIQQGNPTYRVQRRNGMWTINAGAIHGLKNDKASMEATAINIYPENGDPVTVPLASVGLDKSELSGAPLPAGLYKAAIGNITPVINVLLEGTPGELSQWTELAENGSREAKMAFFSGKDIAYDYKVSFENDTILLKDNTGYLVHGIKPVTDKTIGYMYDCCRQVAQWQLLLQLQNKAMNETVFRNDFKTDFSVDVLVDPENEVWKSITDSATLCIEEGQTLLRSIRLETLSNEDYYVAVYSLYSNYGITRRTDDVDASVLTKGQPIPALAKKARLFIADHLEEDTLRLKLIISKRPFKDFFIREYEGLEPEIVDLADNKAARGALMEMEDEAFDQEWYAKTITIRLVRSNGKINAGQSFSAGKVTISAHPALSASAKIGAAPTDTRSLHPAASLAQVLTACGLEVINLNEVSKSTEQPANVIYLSDIENTASLHGQPLEVQLKHDDEVPGEMMAVTMENGIIVPLGVATSNTPGEYNIQIPVLPDNSADGDGSKNLLRAAWFCLVKVVLGKNISKLRWVNYTENRAEYRNDDLADKVKASDRIMLLIHGIIGDTKTQAACMEFLIRENHYDLILAYDYENLNTTIEEIAQDLSDRLEAAGIGAHKPVDIVAHSMGGLVSRYMIEHMPASAGWVDTLYMFGTPNTGSAFGAIPKWRNRITGLLTLACNAGKSFLGSVGPLLEAINKGLLATVPVTNSLAQMGENSAFYKQLNAAPHNVVTTKYYVIAGNMNAYMPDDKTWFSRLVEKIEMQAGTWIYNGVDNDIAVSVESIGAIPDNIPHEEKVLGCHHMNYFEAPLPVKYFKSLQAVATNG